MEFVLALPFALIIVFLFALSNGANHTPAGFKNTAHDTIVSHSWKLDGVDPNYDYVKYKKDKYQLYRSSVYDRWVLDAEEPKGEGAFMNIPRSIDETDLAYMDTFISKYKL